MAAVETGEVAKSTETTALAVTSPADDMKRTSDGNGTQEQLQSSPANVSLEDDGGEELLLRSLQYDLSMRLIVAHQIQKFKLDMKKDIGIYRSLLRDHDGECDRRRRRLAARRTAAREPDDAKEEEEEETTALREVRDMYAKASDVDRRLEEFDEIVWVHYDPDLDNETRRGTVARLWRRLEKELDDRADTVVSGAFKYTFAPLQPRLQSLG